MIVDCETVIVQRMAKWQEMSILKDDKPSDWFEGKAIKVFGRTTYIPFLPGCCIPEVTMCLVTEDDDPEELSGE